MRIGVISAVALVALALGGCATPSAKLPGENMPTQGMLSAPETDQPPRFQTGDVVRRASPEPRREPPLRLYGPANDRERLFRVASAVNAANVDFCERVEPSIGLHAVSTKTLTPDERASFAERSGLGSYAWDGLVVAAVAPGSPAEAAGLRVGQPVLASAASIPPRMSCGYSVILGESWEVNAYAQDESIIVTRGMMNFIRSDAELAVVYGHELAHIAMGHLDAKRVNHIAGQVAGTAIDILLAVGGVSSGGLFAQSGSAIGGGAYSVGFEKEADYIGLYFAHRAGFDTAAAPGLWRRMGAMDGDVQAASTHPTSPERALLMRQTLDEIAAKAAAGLPLVPNMETASTDESRARREASRRDR